MNIRHFRDLQIWQRSISLARTVYTLPAHFPQSETFGLVQQMRRGRRFYTDEIDEIARMLSAFVAALQKRSLASQ